LNTKQFGLKFIVHLITPFLLWSACCYSSTLPASLDQHWN